MVPVRNLHFCLLGGKLGMWRAKGLISPWLRVQISPSPLEKSNRSIKADRLPLNEPVLRLHTSRRLVLFYVARESEAQNG
jgi:hypothetical protein